MSFGIIGNGFVGKATQILKSNNHPMKIYDIDPEKCSPPNITLSDLADCRIIFIAVPTPSNPDGSCHLEIVRSVINKRRYSTYEILIFDISSLSHTKYPVATLIEVIRPVFFG